MSICNDITSCELNYDMPGLVLVSNFCFCSLKMSGEMFIFSYSLFAPQFIYRVVSKDGIVGVPVPITMPGPVIMHDFAISENYAIFMDLPLFLDIWVRTQTSDLTSFA